MLSPNEILDELSSDLQRYLLWWKRAACLAQLTLILAAGLSVQLHGAALLQNEPPLVIGLSIGVFYAAAASAQMAALLPKGFRSRQMGLVAEVLLCLACVWNALVSGNAYLTARLCAGGFASGLALWRILDEWRGLERRYGPTGRCPVTACTGLALGTASLLTGGLLQLMPDTPLAAYAYTCCAVFAVGIRMKFQGQAFYPDHDNHVPHTYTPILQLAKHERLLLALRLLPFIVLGALLAFVFPRVACSAGWLPLLLSAGFLPGTRGTACRHSGLVLGCVLSVCGLPAVFSSAWWAAAIFAGLFLTLRDLESTEARLSLLPLCGCILAGVLAAGAALALS